ncbi:MAG: DinB family protein [Pyrinomonadaceae bacterium]
MRYYHSDPFFTILSTADFQWRLFDEEHMQDFLNDFRRTIEAASNNLLQISAGQSQTPRAAGKWSPREIIGHLIDSASNNHQRFVRAQFTDELVFAGYEQEGWVRAQNYQSEDWADLVQLWRLYNQHILHLMSLVPEETRMKLRHKHNLHQIASENLSESEPVTLDWFMRDYVDHMKKHLRQILGAEWQA